MELFVLDVPPGLGNPKLNPDLPLLLGGGRSNVYFLRYFILPPCFHGHHDEAMFVTTALSHLMLEPPSFRSLRKMVGLFAPRWKPKWTCIANPKGIARKLQKQKKSANTANTRCSVYGLFPYIWVVLGFNVGKCIDQKSLSIWE